MLDRIRRRYRRFALRRVIPNAPKRKMYAWYHTGRNLPRCGCCGYGLPDLTKIGPATREVIKTTCASCGAEEWHECDPNDPPSFEQKDMTEEAPLISYWVLPLSCHHVRSCDLYEASRLMERIREFTTSCPVYASGSDTRDVYLFALKVSGLKQPTPTQ